MSTKESKAENANYDMTGVIKWVAVKDALPEMSKNVLIFTDKGEQHVGRYRGNFWIIGNLFSFDIGEPVFWSQLPEPPCL